MLYPSRFPSDPSRRTARIAGIWFALTFACSIPALLLYGPVLDDPGYVLGAGADARVSLGALLEIFLVIANVATAVVLFPILRRQNEALALGYVAVRLVEAALIVAGIVSLLAVVTLRQDVEAGATAGATVAGAARALVALHDWTFLLGPQFCSGLGNGILLGYLMYASGLVPRRMALLGLVGGPLAFAAGVGVLLGAYDQLSPITFLLTMPEILWEAALALYLTAKGFRPSSLTTIEAPADPRTRPLARPQRAQA